MWGGLVGHRWCAAGSSVRPGSSIRAVRPVQPSSRPDPSGPVQTRLIRPGPSGPSGRPPCPSSIWPVHASLTDSRQHHTLPNNITGRSRRAISPWLLLTSLRTNSQLLPRLVCAARHSQRGPEGPSRKLGYTYRIASKESESWTPPQSPRSASHARCRRVRADFCHLFL